MIKHSFIHKAPIKSDSYSPGMFKREAPIITQSTTVNVTIQEKDDGIAECLSGCFRACFGIAKQAAK